MRAIARMCWTADRYRRRYLAAVALFAASVTPGCGSNATSETRPFGGAITTAAKAEDRTPEPPTGVAEVVASAPKAKLEIAPAALRFATETPGVQVLALRRYADGTANEISRRVTWSTDHPERVQVDARGYLRPLQSGAARVRATDGQESIEIPVDVDFSRPRAWDFATDIAPILTRHGCNTGGCHGRAEGQNGFHLSLFGYDSDGDYAALTRASAARRLDRMNADASLLLRKATGTVAHGGGARLTRSSDDYRTLVHWIQAGAPLHQATAPGALVDVRVEPRSLLLAEPGDRQLRVIAAFEGGEERDVTRLAVFRSNDESVAQVDDTGLVRLTRRGETDIVVRYRSHVVAARMSTTINPDLDFDFGALARKNLIDDHIFRRLEALRVPPSPRSSDPAYLRRLSLDLTGQMPQPDEIKAFCDSVDPDKRAKKVAELLTRQDFLTFWTLKLGDLLQISQQRFGNGAGPYQRWLEDRLAEGAGWDDMVVELMTALGNPADALKGGPVNYALDGADATTRAENTARRFLGVRMRCAQCHDHPFDTWTQDDYYGLAAFFAKATQRGGAGGAMNMRVHVELDPKANVVHLRTKQVVPPRLLGGADAKVSDDGDPRKSLAEWMTRPDNPYFARAMANWTWAQFFGRGIVDPPDDMSAANPPVHPELLSALGEHFATSKFDLRTLIRTIVESEVYGLASATVPGNAHDVRLFSHQIPRPLSAHQMADALAQATQVPNLFAPARTKRKAIEIFEPGSPSAILDAFGRCNRAETCTSVAAPQLSLRQSLLLIGGDVIDGKVTSLDGYLAHMLELEPGPDEIVDYLYMRTLCRPATAEERSHWAHELEVAPSLREASEDLFWALLNSREFAFNH